MYITHDKPQLFCFRAPTMVNIISEEKWRSQYTFSTSRLTAPADFKHYVVVVIPTAKIAQLKLDTKAITGVTWAAIPNTPTGKTYYYK